MRAKTHRSAESGSGAGQAKISARPIKVDKAKIAKLTKKIIRELPKHLKFRDPEEPLIYQRGYNPDTWGFDAGYYITSDVRGYPVAVSVSVNSKNASLTFRSPRQWISGGVVRHFSRSRGGIAVKVLMVVTLDASKTVSSILANLRKVEADVYSVLIHEVTHLRDILRAGVSAEEAGVQRYYNEPTEIRAFMQQIVHEVLEYIHEQGKAELYWSGVSMYALTSALEHSKTWDRIRKNLTPKSKKTMLKGVYTGLQDELPKLQELYPGDDDDDDWSGKKGAHRASAAIPYIWKGPAQADADWELITKDVVAFNKIYRRLKSFERLPESKLRAVLPGRMASINALFQPEGHPFDTTRPLGAWAFRSRAGIKGLSAGRDSRRNIMDAANALSSAVNNPRKYVVDLGVPLTRWVHNLTAFLDVYVDQINDVLRQAGPRRFQYQGIRIENPDRLPDLTIRKLMSGVAYVVALFKRRGVVPLLKETVHTITIRNRSKGERAHGWYLKGSKAIELISEAAYAANGKMMKRWVNEIFLHEVGHHVHLTLLHPVARKAWDAGWAPVQQARVEQPDADNVQNVSFDERKRFWALLVQSKGDLRAIRLKGLARIKFHAWLMHPMMGDPFVTNKQLRWTRERGRRLHLLLSDPERYMDTERGISPEDGDKYAKRLERALRQSKDTLGATEGYSGFNHPRLPDSAVSKYIVDSEALALDALQMPTEYARTNEMEDFAETFVAYMAAPERLSSVSKFRMQKALSLSGLYGKPIMRVGFGAPSSRKGPRISKDEIEVVQFSSWGYMGRQKTILHMARKSIHYLGVLESGGQLSYGVESKGSKSQVARAYAYEVQKTKHPVGGRHTEEWAQIADDKAQVDRLIGLLVHPVFGLKPEEWDAQTFEDDTEAQEFLALLKKQVREWKGSSRALRVINHPHWGAFHAQVVDAVAKKYGSRIRLYRGVHGKQALSVLKGAPLSVHHYSSWAAEKDGAMAYRSGIDRRLGQDYWVVVSATFSPKDVILAPVRLPGFSDPDILMAFATDVQHVGDELVVRSPSGRVDARVIMKSRKKFASLHRIASAWVKQGTRPIQLPTREIKAIARKFTRELRRWGPPKPGRVIAEESLSLTNVRGQAVDVDVLLTGAPKRHTDPFNNELVQGGFLNPRKWPAEIRIFINPYMRSFRHLPDRVIEKDLFRVLAHEFTHAADVWSGGGSVGDLSGSLDDLKRYHHNRPPEIRAMMRDVVTQIDDAVREFMDMGMGFNESVREALEDTKWPEIKPFLTPSNKKTFLKGVYTYLRAQMEGAK